MTALKTDKLPANEWKTDKQPAKGGAEPPSDETHPSGDSPKPQGDPLRHVLTDNKK